MRRVVAALAGAAMLAFAGSAIAQAPQGPPPQRALIKIADNLYRWQNVGHFGVVYVTPAGVIVGDTINAEGSRWLKDEIAKQFNQPVKYVILSHDHTDHTSGAEVFQQAGALVVAHENFRKTVIDEKRQQAIPDITLTDQLNLYLGGKQVEIDYVGRNHSDNMLVVRFPAERVVWTVDWIPVKGLAFREMGESYFPDYFEGLKRVEAMDFDILAPGHGPMGVKADVALFRGYLEDLEREVMAGIRAKKPLEQIKSEVKLEKYKDWGAYQQFLPLNVEGMYRIIVSHRWPN
jgi:glyoxylase-like metal-dependent hydrolase (beta-lactamase superfamily II)